MIATESEPIRLPRNRWILVLIPSWIVVASAAVYVMIVSAETGAYAVTVVAALFGTGALVATWMSLRLGLLATIVTEHEVIAPRLIRGSRRIALAGVAGIGLRYASSGRGSGWRLKLWPETGPALRLPVAPPAHSAPADRRGRMRPGPGVAPALDWNYLADSPAGRAAVAIAERVTRAQGPDGPWTALRREEGRDVPGGGAETAFWSPTGHIGTLPGARRSPL